MNNDLNDKGFRVKLTRYGESQYATVKQFIKDYKGEEWTEEKIEKRTIEIAKILYNNTIEG